MGDTKPDPEYLYGRLSERARLALLRKPQGFVPPEFIGQVVSVCGDDSVCCAAGDDVPHFAILQGPVSEFLYARRRDLDAWWETLAPTARGAIAHGDVVFESSLVDADYVTLRMAEAELR